MKLSLGSRGENETVEKRVGTIGLLLLLESLFFALVLVFLIVESIIGILAVIGFVFGVIKSAVKWMMYSAILGVVAWYFFFQM